MVYLATRMYRVPYVVHHLSPPLLGQYPENPYPYSWRYRRAFSKIRQAVASYVELHPPTLKVGIRGRLEIEAKSALQARAVAGAAAVFVLSNRCAHEIRALYGRDAIVCRGGIEITEVRASNSSELRSELGVSATTPVILSVCRLDYKKRVDLIIRAFAELLGGLSVKDPRPVLIVGGIGPEASRLRELADYLGIAADVRFVGFIPEALLRDYYATSNLFVCAEWADFDLTPYEALSAGGRVLASCEMEFDASLLLSGYVFQAEPQPEHFAAAMGRALAASLGPQPDCGNSTRGPGTLSRSGWPPKRRSLLMSQVGSPKSQHKRPFVMETQ